MRIIASDRTLAVIEKAPGEECEHQLPELISTTLGGGCYPVHRLDRVVGGVIVYARTASAAAHLSRQIAEHTFQKEYLAVVSGTPEPPEGELCDLLFKDARAQKSYVVDRMRKGVKEARLDYKMLAAAESQDGLLSLVRVRLHTGRFHQIRVQFSSRGHPLAGDGKYGSRVKECSVALYSCRIAFCHPLTGQRCEYTAGPPEKFPWDLFPQINDLSRKSLDRQE